MNRNIDRLARAQASCRQKSGRRMVEVEVGRGRGMGGGVPGGGGDCKRGNEHNGRVRQLQNNKAPLYWW